MTQPENKKNPGFVDWAKDTISRLSKKDIQDADNINNEQENVMMHTGDLSTNDTPNPAPAEDMAPAHKAVAFDYDAQEQADAVRQILLDGDAEPQETAAEEIPEDATPQPADAEAAIPLQQPDADNQPIADDGAGAIPSLSPAEESDFDGSQPQPSSYGRQSRYMDVNANAWAILENAKMQAQNTRAEANQEAAATRAWAEREKERILRQAQEAQEAILQNARAQAAQILENARRQGEEEKQLVLETLAEEQLQQIVATRLQGYFSDGSAAEAQARQRLNAAYSSMAQEHSDLIREVDAGAQYLQTSVITSMSDALRKMQQSQEQMLQELDTWRRQLYKTQYRDLAVCFTNLDKLIGSIEKRLVKELACGNEGYHPELAQELQSYSKNLKIFRSNFESCLAKLGIRAYYPAPGTLFNSHLHTLADLDPMTEEDASFNDKPITACVKPGLLRVTQSGEEPLLSALVLAER